MTVPQAPQPAGSAGYRFRFRRWRRARPFWGGLLLMLAGIELFLSGNMNLGALQVHFGPTGFLSYVIPAMLVLCGAMAWATANVRLFYGVMGLLVSVYSMIGLNLGGFLIGLVLGITGGALTIAWSPIAPPAAGPPDAHAEPEPEPEVEPETGPEAAHEVGPEPDEAAPVGAPDEHGSAGARPDREPPHGGGEGEGGQRSRVLAIGLVPATLTAAVLLACNRPAPAYALPCPTPVPTASTSSPSPTPTTPDPSPSTSNPTPTPTTPDPPASTSNPSPTPTMADPSPSASSPSPTPTTPDPSPSASSRSLTPVTPVLATSTTDCVHSGIVRATVGADQPVVAPTSAVLTGQSFTMDGSTYDGVVDLPTRTGTVRSLKFSLSAAVTKPFHLTIHELGGSDTVIMSSALTMDHTVELYTAKFVGTPADVAPVTFTPDSPPPAVLSSPLVFTDVTIDLAFVRCDTLTAASLHVAGG